MAQMCHCVSDPFTDVHGNKQQLGTNNSTFHLSAFVLTSQAPQQYSV